MTRFVGLVGLKQDPQETTPGIFEESIVEVKVAGEIRNNKVRWAGGELSQDKVKANHVVTFIAPASAIYDFSEVAYVTWQNRKFVVVSIQNQHPRISLTLGGIYNG